MVIQTTSPKKYILVTLIQNLSGGSINSQVIITLIATLGAIANGTILGWSSSAHDMFDANYQTPFPVTIKDQQTFSSVIGIGAAFGALPAGYVSRVFGRRISMMLFESLQLVGWAMLIKPTSVWMLSVGRVLQGISAGALCVIIPSYVGEIAEPRMRGRLGTMFQFFIVIGILYSYTFGVFTTYVSFGLFSAIWSLLHFFGILCIPESPYFLMSNNEPDRAAASLQALRDSKNITEELSTIKSFVEQQNLQKYKVSDVLSNKVNCRALLIGIGCMFFQQASGINVVIFYMTDIFKSTGSDINPHVSTITVGVVQLIMTSVSLSVIDKYGRKALLIVSFSIMAICFGGLSGFYLIKTENPELATKLNWLPLLCVAVYISAFSIGCGPVPWVLMGEIYSSEVKPIGTSLTTFTSWMLVFVVTYVFKELMRGLGHSGCFLMFCLFCFTGAAFVIMVVPETKNKSLAEIQLKLIRKRAVPIETVVVEQAQHIDVEKLSPTLKTTYCH